MTIEQQLGNIRENLHQLQAHLLVTRLAVHALIATHPDRPAACAVFEGLSKQADARVGSDPDLPDAPRFQRYFDPAYNELLTALRQPG